MHPPNLAELSSSSRLSHHTLTVLPHLVSTTTTRHSKGISSNSKWSAFVNGAVKDLDLSTVIV